MREYLRILTQVANDPGTGVTTEVTVVPRRQLVALRRAVGKNGKDPSGGVVVSTVTSPNDLRGSGWSDFHDRPTGCGRCSWTASSTPWPAWSARKARPYGGAVRRPGRLQVVNDSLGHTMRGSSARGGCAGRVRSVCDEEHGRQPAGEDRFAVLLRKKQGDAARVAGDGSWRSYGRHSASGGRVFVSPGIRDLSGHRGQSAAKTVAAGRRFAMSQARGKARPRGVRFACAPPSRKRWGRRASRAGLERGRVQGVFYQPKMRELKTDLQGFLPILEEARRRCWSRRTEGASRIEGPGAGAPGFEPNFLTEFSSCRRTSLIVPIGRWVLTRRASGNAGGTTPMPAGHSSRFEPLGERFHDPDLRRRPNLCKKLG